MPQPRKNQISLIDTPLYHCVSRCVRRSFYVVRINLRGRVMSIAEVGSRCDYYFYRRYFLLVFVPMQ
jgi:hypothetical protein